MAKTSIATITADIKALYDYDITDSDLDTLILKAINFIIKKMKTWFLDARIYQDISKQSSFKTIAGQDYVDITKAHIVGDQSTFTGQAGDTIDVNIDGTDYADIDISGAADIDDVVTAINTATGGSQASADDNGYLMITSDTTGSSSTVTIADGTSTAQTVIAELFSVAADRTQSAITDLDEIIKLTDRVNDTDIEIIPYETMLAQEPDPSASSSSTPYFAARWQDYIYFSLRPSAANRVYIDYIKTFTKLTSSDSLPFKDKYDELVIAGAIEWLIRWDNYRKENPSAAALAQAEAFTQRLKKELIVIGSHNIGQNNQTQSRVFGAGRFGINPGTAQ